MAPVRRLRSLAWIKARRFPGVRCSTLNTECRSLLCLITIPGRSWVAGIAILSSPSELSTTESRTACVVRALLPAMRERGADLFGRRKRLILADLAGYAPADPRLTLQTLDFTRTWKAWECGASIRSPIQQREEFI